jgi:hypothetical protein
MKAACNVSFSFPVATPPTRTYYIPAIRFELEAALNAAVALHSGTSSTERAVCKLAVICKAGRHRSVAVAELLHGVLTFLKFKSSLTHTNARYWPGCKGRCDECTAEIDKQFICQAVDMWPATAWS